MRLFDCHINEDGRVTVVGHVDRDRRVLGLKGEYLLMKIGGRNYQSERDTHYANSKVVVIRISNLLKTKTGWSFQSDCDELVSGHPQASKAWSDVCKVLNERTKFEDAELEQRTKEIAKSLRDLYRKDYALPYRYESYVLTGQVKKIEEKGTNGANEILDSLRINEMP